MKKIILAFFIFLMSPFSFAHMMGKDRGGGNGSSAEFVQIMNLSLDLILESSDIPRLDEVSNIRDLKTALTTMDLQPLSNWNDLTYFEKVHIGLENIFLYLKLDSLKAKTNSLILAVYLEELTTQTLEDVFTCSRLTNMKNSDGSAILESFIVSLPPLKAQEFRSSKGLRDSTIAYTTNTIMDTLSMSTPTDMIVMSPSRYQIVIFDEDFARSNMNFEVLGKEIRGDVFVQTKEGKLLTTNPLMDCHWL